AREVASPPRSEAPMFSDERRKLMVAPQLEVGDQLEYRVARGIRVPFKRGDFWAQHYPSRAGLVKTERVVLNVPDGRDTIFKAAPDLSYSATNEAGRKEYRWQLAKRDKDEGGPPRPVFAISTLKQWAEVGDWYLGLQAGRMAVTPQIRALAHKL